jgi:large subunit ribosomal protein L15
MKLHELSPAAGSKKEVKRIGRGPGSGQGKTAGKGHKGQKARAGRGLQVGFEGGQMPLQRRLPKYGEMHVCNPKIYKAINLSDIQALCDAAKIDVVNKEALFNAGLVGKADNVKILGNGTLSAKVKVEAAAFSKSAVAAIEAAGGSVEIKK